MSLDNMHAIPLDRLNEAFIANFQTGELTWRISPSFAIEAGHRAGSRGSKGYQTVSLDRTYLGVHRVLWAMHKGAWPAGAIDHINGNPSDNRIANLRECTPSQNAINSRMPSTNTHGTKGVTLLPHGKWQAQIKINGKSKYLGSFVNKSDAAAAYGAAARELFGEFMRQSEVAP